MAGRGVHGEIEIALPDLGLGVVDPVVLVGQRPQRLGRERPGPGLDRHLPTPRQHHPALGPDMITDVDQAAEVGEGRGSGQVGRQHELGGAGPVLELREDQSTEVADRHDPAGGGDLVAQPQLGARRAPAERGRVGIAARGQQIRPDLHPQSGLFRNPWTGFHRRGHRDRRRHRRPRQSWRRLLVLAQEAGQVDETLGHPGGETHHGDVARLQIAEEPRLPLGVVLHVGTEQGLDLPPAGRDQQGPAEQPDERSRADPGPLLERGPEHREVERHLLDAEFAAGRHQRGHHQFGDAVVGPRAAPHHVEGVAVAAPRHEGQDPRHPAGRAGLGLGGREEGLHHQAVPVGRITEPTEGHRESAFGFRVPPGVSLGDEALQFVRCDVAVVPDAGVISEPLESGHGLAYRAQVAVVQVELARLEDRFVTESDDLESGLRVRGRPRLAGADDRRRPAVRVDLGEPGVDGPWPVVERAEGVAAGQADPQSDPVAHRGPARTREDDRLVPAGVEVGQRVFRRLSHQRPDPRLVGRLQPGGAALRAQQHEQRGDQGDRDQHAENGVDPARRSGVGRSRRRLVIDDRGEDPAEDPAQPAPRSRHSAREQSRQRQADADRRHDADRQGDQSLDQVARRSAGRELAAVGDHEPHEGAE